MEGKQDEPQIIKWGGLLNEFLWTCAGVNKEILRQCKVDYAKYAGIGGTILFTAIMAALSGGYALYTIFLNKWLAFMFAIFWGLLIFNLDRFMVNTMYSDGKVTISWREFSSGLPRILLAIFIGIVISTPLELRVYETGINMKLEEAKKAYINKNITADKQELEKLRKEREENVAQAIAVGNNQIDTKDYDSQIAFLKKEIKAQTNNIARYQRLIKENPDSSIVRTWKAYIRNNQSSIASRKKQIREIEEERRRQVREREDLNRTINKSNKGNISVLDQQIAKLDAKVSKGETHYEEMAHKNLCGFQGRMKAFNEMKKEDTSTNLSAFFISLLFIIIETVPTFFKMMIAAGPYDDYLRAEMYASKMAAEKRISDLNDSLNTDIRISTRRNNQKAEVEILANEDVLKKIALAQSELLDTAIEEWKSEEMQKIKESPSNYIKSNNNG